MSRLLLKGGDSALGKTRFSILRPLNRPNATAPQKDDLLLFTYQETEKVQSVVTKFSDNVFFVLSQENNSYLVYWYSAELLSKFNKGMTSNLAQIGTSQEKIKVGKKLKLLLWKYGDDSVRTATSVGTVKAIETIITEVQTLIQKITTTTGIYFVMS